MNVIVIPDGAMIIVPLIEKNGHNYLSPTNFSRYDNDLDLNPDFNVNLSCETPSGVRGRISLLTRVLYEADAAIVLGRRPSGYNSMYSVLNELILFCGNGCQNAYSLSVNMLSKLNIPTLKLAYPTTRCEIIHLIDKVNVFLKDLTVDNDDLNCDLVIEKDKFDLNNFKKILNNLV